jgi:citrate lyase subunit beta/citryl-CoA lyase
MDALYQSHQRRPLPTWRSVLYIPANNSRLIEKAPTAKADALTIDLEDSVPPQEKERARAMLPATVAHAASAGADVIVRINRPLSLAVRDIEAAVCRHVKGLNIPKVDGPSHVRLLDELVSECESRQGLPLGHTVFLVAIETPRAYGEMFEIASASPRVVAMMLASEDMALECGFEPSEETLLLPKQQMIFAASAAGVRPMGFLGSVAQFKDIDAFRQMVRRSRRFGFTGASCIHPAQAAILNEEFAPSAQELAWAERVVREGEQALSEGRGAFLLEGSMIDEPIIARARRMLALSAAMPKGWCAASGG